jgi:hypothetical protein
MKTIVSVITAGAILLSGGFVPQVSGQKMHVLSDLKDAVWGPAPPMLPAGAQIAVLAGDPTKPVPYTVRLKFPANYAIPAHSHPTDENVVVVTGAVTFGMGEKLAKSDAGNKTLPAGGFALMPANMNPLRLHHDGNHHRSFRSGARGIQIRESVRRSPLREEIKRSDQCSF